MADDKPSELSRSFSEDSKSKNNEEQELADLLDDALKEFKSSEENEKALSDSASRILSMEEIATLKNDLKTVGEPSASSSSFANDNKIFTAEELCENLQRLASQEPSTLEINEFSTIIGQTLKSLAENADDLQNQFTEDEKANILKSFANFDEPSSENEILPLMKNMMESLMSKEVLYPALSSILEKYPQWLEDNKHTLSETDFKNYSEQLKVMREVCAELDTEMHDDTQEIKFKRFEVVLALMQKLQDYGQPPIELAGDLGPMLNLDEMGIPQIPSGLDAGQCSLM